jgi:hypothetical protein
VEPTILAKIVSSGMENLLTGMEVKFNNKLLNIIFRRIIEKITRIGWEISEQPFQICVIFFSKETASFLTFNRSNISDMTFDNQSLIQKSYVDPHGIYRDPNSCCSGSCRYKWFKDTKVCVLNNIIFKNSRCGLSNGEAGAPQSAKRKVWDPKKNRR